MSQLSKRAAAGGRCWLDLTSTRSGHWRQLEPPLQPQGPPPSSASLSPSSHTFVGQETEAPLPALHCSPCPLRCPCPRHRRPRPRRLPRPRFLQPRHLQSAPSELPRQHSPPPGRQQEEDYIAREPVSEAGSCRRERSVGARGSRVSSTWLETSESTSSAERVETSSSGSCSLSGWRRTRCVRLSLKLGPNFVLTLNAALGVLRHCRLPCKSPN